MVLLSVLLVLGAGCDAVDSDPNASAPPPRAAAPAAPPSTAPAAPEAATPTTPPDGAADPEAPSARVLPSKSSPAADKDTRHALLLQHYRTLRCLTFEGASTAEVSAAFAASGLTPHVWNQALGELLQVMADAPDGEVARAVQAADSEVCSGRGPQQ
jgi:hypothetical protein